MVLLEEISILGWLKSEDVLTWCRWGKILYGNVQVEGDFLYGSCVAKKIVWRFYWLVEK